jgi:hypothetical protein
VQDIPVKGGFLNPPPTSDLDCWDLAPLN